MASSKKIKKELECLLTQEELNAIGVKSSEIKYEARMLKEKASALEKDAKAMDEQVANKKVKRQVECVEDKDFNRNAVILTRTDDEKYWPEGTAIVETRAMTVDERQTLFDTGDDDDSDKPPKVTTKAPKGRSRGKSAEPN
jgi:hypothetical protein